MATLNDFGIPGVGSGIMHPKHKNRWRITFANLGGGIDSQPVSMQAVEVQRPTVSHGRIELHRYNSVAYVAGKHEWSPISLTLEDDILGAASTVVQAQLQKQQWLIGAEGQWLATAAEGSLYKFVTYMDSLDGNDQVVEKWILEGCWIEKSEYDTFDYSTADQMKISLSISYDHARQSIGGYRGMGQALGGGSTV